MTSAWIRTFPAQTTPRLALFCLPHAGGNASLFRGWRAQLAHDIDLHVLCYPGRLERWQQQMPASMTALVQQVADAMTAHVGDRWAIFGHSMGAVVAHEVVLELQRRGVTPPQLLAVSAREAPQFHQPGTLHQQDDEALCHALLRLQGTDPALLAMADVRALILPTLRADYALIERWTLSSPQPLRCPIAAFVGNDDPELNPAQAAGWSAWTTAHFTLDRFSGGHFYFSDNPQPLLARLQARLQDIQAAL